MEVMIDRDQGHYFPGSKARLIRNELMIYPYRSHDLSGSRSLFSGSKARLIRNELMIYTYGSHY
jgi:hypothetical protein